MAKPLPEPALPALVGRAISGEVEGAMRMRGIVAAALVLSGVAACPASAAGQAPKPVDEFVQQRRQMVADQIEARGIEDERVLAAMRAVPRHEFVPPPLRGMAYSDRPLPIGEGQTISQPYIVALMTELAEITPGERVLEIGTGSGYQAAVLAELTDSVYTIELLPGLAAQARRALDGLGLKQVRSRVGDGYLGWPEAAPFGAILVTAAPDHIPQPLVEQLADGGMLVVPVGPTGGIQRLIRLRKTGEVLTEEEILPVRFVPLIHEEPQL